MRPRRSLSYQRLDEGRNTRLLAGHGAVQIQRLVERHVHRERQHEAHLLHRSVLVVADRTERAAGCTLRLIGRRDLTIQRAIRAGVPRRPRRGHEVADCHRARQPDPPRERGRRRRARDDLRRHATQRLRPVGTQHRGLETWQGLQPRAQGAQVPGPAPRTAQLLAREVPQPRVAEREPALAGQERPRRPRQRRHQTPTGRGQRPGQPVALQVIRWPREPGQSAGRVPRQRLAHRQAAAQRQGRSAQENLKGGGVARGARALCHVRKIPNRYRNVKRSNRIFQGRAAAAVGRGP